MNTTDLISAAIIRQQLEGVSWITFAIMAIMGSILVLLFRYLYRRLKGKKLTLRRTVWYFLIVIYLSILFQVTYDRRDGEVLTGIDLSINFGCFDGNYFHAQTALYNIFNVIMFVPWGILATGMFSHSRTRKAMLLGELVCMVTTMAIEFVQLISKKGLFELNDIIMNSIGGLLGVFVFISIYHLIHYGGVNEEKLES